MYATYMLIVNDQEGIVNSIDKDPVVLSSNKVNVTILNDIVDQNCGLVKLIAKCEPSQ